MHRVYPSHRPRRIGQAQRGFMLIEVLVGLLLFSLGILGLVGLQASMTQSQTAAKVRADAAFLASELIGTMWGDMSNLGSYASANCSGYGPCKDWQSKVAKALPGGTLKACNVTTATGDVTITIEWTMPNGGGTNSYSTTTTIARADAT